MSGMLAPVPATYAGVEFRSTLEADWAATLDSLGIVWQYEPEAVRLPSGTLYRPDFYLPRIATWLEVKGPHRERIKKTIEFAKSVPDPVIIGLASERGLITWESLNFGPGGGELFKCRACDAWWWLDWSGPYGCRAHRRDQWGEDDLGEAGDRLPFVRASGASP